MTQFFTILEKMFDQKPHRRGAEAQRQRREKQVFSALPLRLCVSAVKPFVFSACPA
jgi:hypothetical protein